MNPEKILIIQTAFIGDVILATPVFIKLKKFYPEAKIDFLLRKGCETLLLNEKRINEVLIWEKKKNKYLNLIKLLFKIREKKYSLVINIQRFASTGMLSMFSGAGTVIGFKQNPFSFAFTRTVNFETDKNRHETERNLSLVYPLTDKHPVRPELIIDKGIEEGIYKKYKTNPYIVIAPGSVWFTKTYPVKRWVMFLDRLKFSGNVYLIGSKDDATTCADIANKTQNNRVTNVCGLQLQESISLIKGAEMNYVNDSAPMHIASASNAPVTAIFCSTLPEFGFGPLSDCNYVVETHQFLPCRPCGLHGFKECREKHFKCSEIEPVFEYIPPKPKTL